MPRRRPATIPKMANEDTSTTGTAIDTPRRARNPSATTALTTAAMHADESGPIHNRCQAGASTGSEEYRRIRDVTSTSPPRKPHHAPNAIRSMAPTVGVAYTTRLHVAAIRGRNRHAITPATRDASAPALASNTARRASD